MHAIIPFVFQKRLFLFLFLTFIAFTVIGTLSHECGHYFAARYFGYNHARINYAATMYGPHIDNRQERIMDIWYHDSDAIKNNYPFPRQKEYNVLLKEMRREGFIVTSAGPIETMLTGSIGLLLLFIYRKRYWQAETLKAWQWFYIILSLFWLRQLFNLVCGIVVIIIKGKTSGRSDEERLSYMLHIPHLTIYLVTGTIALMVLYIVVFKFIPVRQRFTFLSAGLLGGLIGAALWLVLLGPTIMP